MHKVTFSAKFESLNSIRELVGKFARKAGFNDKDVYSIQLAADEAASNIIEHAYEGVKNGHIEVSLGLEGDTLRVVMHDHGKAFDPSGVAQPDLKANLSERKIGGLGIYLMRRLMDDVSYESLGRHGNTLTMTKRKA